MFNFFILFCLVFSCIGVILPKNPVYNLLSLVCVFCIVSIYLILLGLDFIGFLIVFIYVGAICILFLFVLMFIEVPFLEVSNIVSFSNYWFSFFVLLFVAFGFFFMGVPDFNLGLFFINRLNFLSFLNESQINQDLFGIGVLFYSDFSVGFLLCAFILLVAMINVILIAFLFGW